MWEFDLESYDRSFEIFWEMLPKISGKAWYRSECTVLVETDIDSLRASLCPGQHHPSCQIGREWVWSREDPHSEFLQVRAEHGVCTCSQTLTHHSNCEIGRAFLLTVECEDDVRLIAYEGACTCKGRLFHSSDCEFEAVRNGSCTCSGGMDHVYVAVESSDMWYSKVTTVTRFGLVDLAVAERLKNRLRSRYWSDKLSFWASPCPHHSRALICISNRNVEQPSLKALGNFFRNTGFLDPEVQTRDASVEVSAILDLHNEFQALLGSISLCPRDLQNLEQRGLTKRQIANIGFKSWLGGKLHVPFLRCSADSKASKFSMYLEPALLIPAKNPEGLILGLHARPHIEKGGKKYCWVSRESNFKLPVECNGREVREDPMFCCWPSAASGEGIETEKVVLVEGPLKAYVVAHLQNVKVISQAGVNFYQPRFGLISNLARMGAREVVIYPDAGAIANCNVLLGYFRTFRMLIFDCGVQVSVGWWGQWTKDDRDADDYLNENENTPHVLIQTISIMEFWNYVKPPMQMECRKLRLWDVFAEVLGETDTAGN